MTTPDELMIKYRKLVYYVLNKDFKELLNDEDAAQEGLLGLWRALESYEEGKGGSIETHACTCIKNAIMDYIRKDNSLKRIRTEDTISLNDETSPINERTIADTNKTILFDEEEYKKRTDEMDRQIIYLKEKGYTNQEVAIKYGMTKRGIEKRLQKVRKSFEDYLY